MGREQCAGLPPNALGECSAGLRARLPRHQRLAAGPEEMDHPCSRDAHPTLLDGSLRCG